LTRSLGFGARKPAELDLPGRELRGVTHALDLLVQEEAGAEEGALRIEVAGKRVLVIGGGDMALAAARMAVRRNAASTACVYRRDAANMPCSRSEYENALEEGVRFVERAVPLALVGNGQVAEVRLARPRRAPDPGAARLAGAGRHEFRTGRPGVPGAGVRAAAAAVEHLGTIARTTIASRWTKLMTNSPVLRWRFVRGPTRCSKRCGRLSGGTGVHRHPLPRLIDATESA
jgi:hypothetical protein